MKIDREKIAKYLYQQVEKKMTTSYVLGHGRYAEYEKQFDISYDAVIEIVDGLIPLIKAELKKAGADTANNEDSKPARRTEPQFQKSILLDVPKLSIQHKCLMQIYYLRIQLSELYSKRTEKHKVNIGTGRHEWRYSLTIDRKIKRIEQKLNYYISELKKQSKTKK